MVETFEDRNLAQARFHKINLRGALFEDVNLESTCIRNANLMNVSIEDANIRGMTVFGFRIDELIEAELDRRDPERVRLKMDDPHVPKSVRSVFEHLEELRCNFRTTLRNTNTEYLLKRPAKDQWSAMEHLRHLVFAEDLYINHRILKNNEQWCKLGLLPRFLVNNPAYSDVGSEPCDDLETVLAALDRIHVRTRAYVTEVTTEKLLRKVTDIDFGQGTVGHVLQGMALHELHHIRKAESAVKVTQGTTNTNHRK